MVHAAEAIWHIDRRGKRIGPVSPFELAYLARNRHLDEHDLIWSLGMADWIEAGSVAGLLPSAEARRVSMDLSPSNGLPGPSLSALYAHYLARYEPAKYEPASVAQSAPSPVSLPRAADVSGNAMTLIAEALDQSDSADTSARQSSGQPEQWAQQPVQATQAAFTASTAAWMHTDAISPSAAASLPAAPLPAPVAGAAAGSSGTSPAARRPLFSADIGRTAADAVIVALDKFEIRTVEDLASDDQLRTAAAFAYDLLPGTVRFLAHQTIGRSVLEGHLVEMLITIRNRIPPGQRQRDIRALVDEMAATPWLSQRIGAIYGSTREGIGSVVASYKPQSLLPQSWRGAPSNAMPAQPPAVLAAPQRGRPY